MIATGPRAQDLAVRLTYAEGDHRVIPDLAAAVAAGGGGTPAPGSPTAAIDTLATYTPFQKLLKMAGLR